MISKQRYIRDYISTVKHDHYAQTSIHIKNKRHSFHTKLLKNINLRYKPKYGQNKLNLQNSVAWYGYARSARYHTESHVLQSGEHSAHRVMARHIKPCTENLLTETKHLHVLFYYFTN